MLSDVYEAACELAARLETDIQLASTRQEHIRVSARASEAALLAAQLHSCLYLEKEPAPTLTE